MSKNNNFNMLLSDVELDVDRHASNQSSSVVPSSDVDHDSRQNSTVEVFSVDNETAHLDDKDMSSTSSIDENGWTEVKKKPKRKSKRFNDVKLALAPAPAP
jgi:hypothetical protein